MDNDTTTQQVTLHDRLAWTFEVQHVAPHGPDDLIVRQAQLTTLLTDALAGQPGTTTVVAKAVQSRKANP